MEKKWTSEEKTPGMRNMARVVKLVKVPTWTKDMTLKMFERELGIWKSSNADVPENT